MHRDSEDVIDRQATLATGSLSTSHMWDGSSEDDDPCPKAREAIRGWQRAYARRVFITDAFLVTLSAAAAQFAVLAKLPSGTTVAQAPVFGLEVSYFFLSCGLVALWLLALLNVGAWEPRALGSGITEYKRVVTATIGTFGILAIAAFMLQLHVARTYMVVAFPAALILLILGRYLWRHWLHRKRANGQFLRRALVVGEPVKAHHVRDQITRSPQSGYNIVGEVVSVDDATLELHPFVASASAHHLTLDELLDALDETASDTLILTSSDILTPQRTRQLGWELDRRRIELIVAPALTGIAGPRIHISPVAGLPLLHIGYPRMKGPNALLKRAFDIFASAVLILLLSPVLLGVAIAVKLTSLGGPVLFKQERVGQGGRPFKMLKFRSMVPNAPDLLKRLLEEQGSADKPLFKVDNDPRITPVGRFIRRYSLDELPQLFNVLFGTMSLVGPRPQVADEVALYDRWAHRRLMVKPGITGLWQVSGRSNLSWEDAIRLDLYYVENWSLIGDLTILARTIQAVVAPDGAY